MRIKRQMLKQMVKAQVTIDNHGAIFYGSGQRRERIGIAFSTS
jgi:hypothetical protein